MNKLILGILCMVILNLSCSKQSDIIEIPDIKEVKATICDFDYELEDVTRTLHTLGSSRYEVNWTDGDILGIYPAGGTQVAFPISGGFGEKVALFNGNKIPLNSTIDYTAYYPFNKDNYMISESLIPISYTDQVQYGNNSVTNIPLFDYLVSNPTKPNSDNTIIFDMKHVGCIFLLKLTMPKSGTYTKVTLTSNNKEFTVNGTLNLMKEEHLIMSTSTSKTISISLNDVTLKSENELLTVNLMIAPKDLSNSDISITVLDSNGETYTTANNSNIIGKKYMPNKAYIFIRKMVALTSDTEEDKENSTGAELEPGGGIEEG